MIDQEVRNLVEGAYRKAYELLETNIDKLHRLANALLEREILDHEEMDKLLRGEELDPVRRPRRAPEEDAQSKGEAAESQAAGATDRDDAAPRPRDEGPGDGDGGGGASEPGDTEQSPTKSKSDREPGKAAREKGTAS
jgi:cell division protease FtsH